MKKKFSSLDTLKYIGDEPRQTPILISRQFGMSLPYIRTIMVILNDLGLVEREARGIYTLTDLGLKVLEAKLHSKG